METEQDDVYLEWLSDAPKGVRWDKAQEMYAEFKRRRREKAGEIARRLLGKQSPPKRIRCGDCFGAFSIFCKTCLGEGEIDA